MNMKTVLGQWVLLFASAWLYAQNSFAGIQTSENFDTNWPGAPWGGTSYSNMVNPVSGWSINSNSITASATAAHTLPNSCALGRQMSGNAWVQSPALTNGIGAFIFFVKGANSSTNILSVERSYDLISWSTNIVITNSIGTWTGYTNIIDSMSNQYLRIRRLDANGVGFYIDTIQISYPTPQVTVSNVVPSLSRPTDQDPVTISANIGIQSVPDTFAMTNYWRLWPATNWTPIAMTSNSPTHYTASSAIPSNSIGSAIEYFARASFTGNNVTNTADSIITNYVVLPQSSYTNLAVTGLLNAPLRNGANYQQQGVIQVTNINPTFKFQDISNGVTNTWGDVNQAITNIPLYGQAELASNSNITLYTTNAGYYVFTFNETNLDYSVRSCTYENFNIWTNIDTSISTPSTNNTGWVLVSGNTSNDVSRIFSGTGRSAIIETNGWLQTPNLTNGVGPISFWYRNWSTTGAPTGKFQVEVSSNAVNWTALANGSVSNIVSTNYLFFSGAANDQYSKYVRILNTNTTARICLDEVVIAQPGAYVSSTNLVISPTSPTLLDPISVSIDLTPYNGATITAVTNWYRVGTNGQWQAAAMTNAGSGHYTLSTPLIGVPQGTSNFQYAVQYFFSGFQATSPVFFPLAGTNNPVSVDIIDPNVYREENFDTNWPGAPWGGTSYSNMVNPVSGWSINSNSITASATAAHTLPNSCALGRQMSGNAWVQSPALTNGIGAFIFFVKGANSSTNILSVESSYDKVSWVTNLVVTNNNGSWLGYTNVINSMSNRYLRIRRLDNNNVGFYIDTLRITYPPANISITNVFLSPGYPVAGLSATVSCDIISLNPYFPAYNIAPTLYYGPQGSATTPLAMTRTLVTGNTSRFSGEIPLASVMRDTYMNYRIIAPFDGYYGSPLENQSPMLYPGATSNNFIGFPVRAYSSTYSNFSAIINGVSTTGRMLTNGLWQSIVNLTSVGTNFTLSGIGYSTGTGYATSSITIGNTNNWQTAVPLADIGTTGLPPFSVSLTNGQYVVRYDEASGQYIVQQCAWQGFDQLSDTAGIYKRLSVNVNAENVVNSFDSWAVNTTRTRSESFTDLRWSAATDYTNNFGGGDDGFLIYGSKITSASVQTTNITAQYQAFIVQPSHWGNFPLRGIGTMQFSYKATVTNPVATLAAYFFPTNRALDQADTTVFRNPAWWGNQIPTSQTNVFDKNSFKTTTVVVKTNENFDVILSQDSGSQSLYLDDISVSEWYADTKTNDGWIAANSWIETSGVSGAGNCCRFEPTRSATGVEQSLRTPMLSNGVYTVSFQYCGTTTNPVSFDVLMSEGDPDLFTNKIASITNTFTGTKTDYTYYAKTLNNNSSNLYLKILSTTPAPGGLLVDDIKITPCSFGDTWDINNAAVNASAQGYVPVLRQFYAGACYLNSNRVSNISTDPADAPNTNEMPYVAAPAMDGIGEISFWYRNWATPPNAVKPARLLIQSTPDGTTPTWTTISIVSNIVNTNDYIFYQTSVHNTNRSIVRICNDDTYTNAVGRVCLDEILITTPMASSLSMSNLVITPAIPLYSNTVAVAVDVSRLFMLAPSNLIMSIDYGTGSSYSAMTNAAFSGALAMSCISTTVTAQGRSYRYATVTPIPSNATDTFVKYAARANFTGYHPEAHSPSSHNNFAVTPTWYNPLPTTGIAYYVTFSCPTGSVWINEINYGFSAADKTNEYVELCGTTNLNILGWSLRLVNSATNIYGTYTITNENAFGNSTNGYGFWVLGDSNVPSRSLVFTNAESGGKNLYEPGGVALLRSCGTYVDAISYGAGSISILTNAGYTYTAKEILFANSSIYMTGTVGALKWVYNTSGGNHHTPGIINESEWFPSSTEGQAPAIIITAFLKNTNVWIECTSAALWVPTPWYTSDLLNTNSWTNVSAFATTYPNLSSSNTFTVHFEPPTNNPVFFKIITTYAP